MKSNERKLISGMLFRGLSSIIGAGLLLFISAGTITFPGAWILLGVLICLGLSFGLWLYYRYPQQFFNRLQPAETDPRQQRIIMLISIVLCLTLLIAGLDRRYGWSHLSGWRFFPAGILLATAIFVYRSVFITNPFLLNIVTIQEKQCIINKGVYRIVRHPMYLANCLTCAACILILGSLATIPLYLVFVGLLVQRALGEEEQLICAFPEYKDYKREVKYCIFPFLF